MKKYLYAFIFTWTLALHFLAFENPRVQKVISYFKTENQKVISPSSIAEDYELVIKFLNSYYPIDEKSDSDQIYRSVEKLVLAERKDELLEGYKENLDFLIQNKSKRSFELEKILRKKDDGQYVAYLNMKKSLKGSKNYPYVFKVLLDLKKETGLSEDSVKITDFKEFVVTNPTKELIDKTLMVESGVATNSDFPCKTNALSADKNEDEVEYKVLPSGKALEFKPSDQFSSEAKFKAVCGRRSFEIKLASNDAYSTLYQKFELTDGQLKPLPLSKEKKLENNIKELFGGEVIND